MPSVLSVNVGGVRHIEWHGETISTGIWKQPVSGRVAVHGVNLAGDDQADRTVHGGPDKAVYAYASEDYAWWRRHSDIPAEPALFGENLTTEGLDLAAAIVGERWAVGSTLLEVAQPRLPCYKLGIRVGDDSILRTFLIAGRLGAYLRIVRVGDIGAADAIEVLERPAHGVTLRDMAESLDDPSRCGMLQRVSYLPAFWKKVAARSSSS